jgi:hypothetical protein
MRVETVDPRDTLWEDNTPVYRVYFWSKALAPPEISPEKVGWRSDEYEIHDAADVHEVITWAQGPEHGGRAFTLYVSLERNGEPGLVHLARVDPTIPRTNDPRT